MPKKAILVIAISLVAFIIFALIVILIFNAMINNPYDNISIPYIYDDTDIAVSYGDIVSVKRNTLYEKTDLEFYKKIPYSIETKNCRIIVYVAIENENNEWKAISYEIIKVIHNEDDF